jgi:hypothetical protein
VKCSVEIQKKARKFIFKMIFLKKLWSLFLWKTMIFYDEIYDLFFAWKQFMILFLFFNVFSLFMFFLKFFFKVFFYCFFNDFWKLMFFLMLFVVFNENCLIFQWFFLFLNVFNEQFCFVFDVYFLIFCFEFLCVLYFLKHVLVWFL